jgi:hypothetical protein
VAHVSAKGCSMGRGVGGGERDEGEGRKWWRRCEGRVGGDYVREVSFPTNLERVSLCGP